MQRLLAIVPPPSKTHAASGDRAAAATALGYDLPESVWQVIEHYGDGAWLEWLWTPSPYAADGVEALQARSVEEWQAGGRLVAFSDPEGFSLFAPRDDDRISVLVDDNEIVATGMLLPDLLATWLEGGETPLSPVADFIDGFPPYFAPGRDPARSSKLVWLEIEGEMAAHRAQFFATLDEHVVYARQPGQDTIYVPALEMKLVFDTINRQQLHVTFYDDRGVDVKSALLGALAAASLTIRGVSAPRGRTGIFQPNPA